MIRLSTMRTLLGFGLLSLFIACSSSTTTSGGDAGSSGGGGGGQDGGGGSSGDGGGSQQQDSGGGGNSCGTPGGTFTCGSQSCRIDDQYCVGDSMCLDFDGCPSCDNPSIHCGIGSTPTCTGTANAGIHVTCN